MTDARARIVRHDRGRAPARRRVRPDPGRWSFDTEADLLGATGCRPRSCPPMRDAADAAIRTADAVIVTGVRTLDAARVATPGAVRRDPVLQHRHGQGRRAGGERGGHPRPQRPRLLHRRGLRPRPDAAARGAAARCCRSPRPPRPGSGRSATGPSWPPSAGCAARRSGSPAPGAPAALSRERRAGSASGRSRSTRS